MTGVANNTNAYAATPPTSDAAFGSGLGAGLGPVPPMVASRMGCMVTGACLQAKVAGHASDFFNFF